MINSFEEQNSRSARAAAARSHQGFFCIHSYAGESGPPCGWRGYADELSRDKAGSARRCPRCGRSTVMEIPSQPAE